MTPIDLAKPQSDAGIAFALIGVVLALLITGSVVAAYWPVISAWWALVWDDPSENDQ